MTMYQKIKRIAKPTVKAYHTDLTKHDLAACRRMQDGETALWSCRAHGTHFIWLAHKTDSISPATLENLRNSLNWFDAVAKVFGNEDGAKDWYLLEKIGEAVIPVTADQAREMFVSRIKAIECRLRLAA